MNEKLSAAKAFLKRVWDKVFTFLKFVWAFIAKAYAIVSPKVVSGAKFACAKSAAFLKTIVKDKQKLILAIILAIAVLFSCIAVIRTVKGVVGGIAGIFASDKADEENEEIASESEAVAAESNNIAPENSCSNCVDGVCIHCENGFIDCPECEEGFCVKCGGTGQRQSKLFGSSYDCISCKATGKCSDCNEDFMIDCKYCDGGKCAECTEENAE